MLLRLALKLFCALCILSACSPQDRQAADKLNSLSYAYHYRNLDSTAHYARLAYEASAHYETGRAEALNNLAFVSMSRMRYDEAQQRLDSVSLITDNQLELLIANIQQMRLCQRRSRNKEFYDYREYALRALSRINEEREWLADRQKDRLRYAESEMAIVTSTYYYYVGLEQQSAEELQKIPDDLAKDTAQWMNYLYNVGAGGIISEGTPAQIEQKEFDYLMQCFLLSLDFGSPYFLANSLEGLADHLNGEVNCLRLAIHNPIAMEQLGVTEISIKDIPIYLAEHSLSNFQLFGDVYQIAGAYRTLASSYREKGDYEQALFYFEQALNDTTIEQAPDLVASIHEQLSVAFSAVNNKEQSDYHRNIYLDLQEQTRQDRMLEARAGMLDQTLNRLNVLLIAVAVSLVLLLVFLRFFFLYYKRRMQKREAMDELEEEREEIEEQLLVERRKKEQSERRHLEQRAKISLVNSIMPLIDRMLHDVKHLKGDSQLTDNPEQLQYARELTDQINLQNDVLTHWIQLRQGELNLHIETFELQALFDLIEKSQRSFAMGGLELKVEPTTALVKADRVLTIFMLNTLADNARKFTPSGGKVYVSASEGENYVEISVADTGKGMDEEELSHIFEHKVSGGHGFGLLNCKGIIEKYKKTSQLFSVCQLAAESRKGEGSRFFFRLPKGIVRTLLLLLLGTSAVHAEAVIPEDNQRYPEDYLQKASSYADSAYYSNINGTYERTVSFADTCLHFLNMNYRQQAPRGRDTLQILNTSSAVIYEIQWLRQQIPLNYNILLSVRNECAVAALALHEWELYHYNNRIYTLLFKELSADRTLDGYCWRMQRLNNNMMVAIVLLVLIFLALLTALVFQLIQAISRRAERQQEKQDQLELLRDELRRQEMECARLHVSNQVLENCLSTLKHETMYYPSRIQQLIASGDIVALQELVAYYRELYGILSEQADRQVRGVKLHMQPLDHEIFGDQNLIGYLFEILRKQSNQKKLAVTYQSKEEKYVLCRVQMPHVSYTDFMPTIENIPYLLCRQIVREHGEATGLRACGIRAEQQEDGMTIILVLPRYVQKKS